MVRRNLVVVAIIIEATSLRLVNPLSPTRNVIAWFARATDMLGSFQVDFNPLSQIKLVGGLLLTRSPIVGRFFTANYRAQAMQIGSLNSVSPRRSS